MATPITWQNIRGPSLSEASRPLESAQRALGGMFDQFGGLIREREKINADNWTAGRTNNTAAFLDQLAQFKTPEALAAAQQAGTLQALRSQFGTQIDANAIRGAEDQRLSALRLNAKQGIDFENMMKDERSMPFMQQFKTASLRGDKLGMAAAEAAYTQAGGRNLADLVGYNDTRLQQLTERDRAGDKHNWAGEAHKDGLLTSGVQRTTALGNLEINRGQLDLSRTNAAREHAYRQEQLGFQRTAQGERSEDRITEKRLKLISALGDVDDNSPRSAKGMAQIEKAIAGHKDEETQNNARLLVQDLEGKGIPASDVARAVSSLNMSRWYNTDSGNRGDAASRVLDGVAAAQKGPNGDMQIKGPEFQRKMLLKELSRLEGGTSTPFSGGNPAVKADAAATLQKSLDAIKSKPNPTPHDRDNYIMLEQQLKLLAGKK